MGPQVILSLLGKFLTSKVGLVALCVALAFGTYKYYEYHQAEIDVLVDELELERQKLEESLLRHHLTKATMAKERAAVEEEMGKMQRNLVALAEREARSRREADELSAKFEKHDFGHLAKKKPGLVFGIVNRGTSRVFMDIEEATGADRPDPPD